MKGYSSARAGKGKTAYRTPSGFKYRYFREVQKRKINETNNRKYAVKAKGI
ncbi:MAG: hypothetical protein V1845_01445 [bacterium]